jgi:hypothetical protein
MVEAVGFTDCVGVGVLVGVGVGVDVGMGVGEDIGGGVEVTAVHLVVFSLIPSITP